MRNILGERLKSARVKAGQTQEDIAKLLRVQRQVISYFENGSRTPNIDDLIKLAEIFGTSTDYLLGLTDAQSTDLEVKYICDYTGLSEKAVSELHNSKELINDCNDKRAIIVESMTEYAHSCEAAFDIVNLFIKGHMFQWGDIFININ